MLLRYAQYKGVINLDICKEGDAIMADKGFLISDLCTPRGVSLIIPPFKKEKKRFLPHEVEATKTIANLRIHVEREMERIKNFRSVCQSPWLHRRLRFGRYVSDSQTSHTAC